MTDISAEHWDGTTAENGWDDNTTVYYVGDPFRYSTNTLESARTVTAPQQT